MYLLITILRSVRADFAPEIWHGLGVQTTPSVFATAEILIGAVVLALFGSAAWIDDNRRAFFYALSLAIAAIDACRRRGMKVGSSTGYTTDLMKPLVEAMRQQGLTVDAVVCADDVPQGRPAPWLCLENARRLGIFPVQSIVVIDDTSVGIAAGLHAGMWTIGVAQSGNSVGLSEAELNALPPEEQAKRVSSAKDHLLSAGAHLVVDTVANLPKALESIEACIDLGISPEGL